MSGPNYTYIVVAFDFFFFPNQICTWNAEMMSRIQMNLLWFILVEVVLHLWRSRTTSSAPSRSFAHTWKELLAKPKPSCLQTTMASMVPQPSPHTVPHAREPFFSTSTSTRPSKGFRPPLKRSYRYGRQERHVVSGSYSWIRSLIFEYDKYDTQKDCSLQYVAQT